MQPVHPSRNDVGFTLIELLVVVLILGLVAALALPGFQSTISRNRVASQHNELLAGLSMARSEAIRRNAPVSLCAATATQDACQGSWGRDWLVWQDTNSNNTVDTGEEVLQVGGVSDTESLSSPSGHFVLRFSPRGLRVVPDTGAASLLLGPGTCPTGQKLKRTISVLITGATSSTQDNC